MATLQLIVVVTAPPSGVVFAIQSGRDGLQAPFASTPDAISFALVLDVGAPKADESFGFRGPFVQGRPSDRFVYLNSGSRAGQPQTPWDRRAKIKLGDLPSPLIRAALGDPDQAVEVRVPGTMRDGGPVCATVPVDRLTTRLLIRARAPDCEPAER